MSVKTADGRYFLECELPDTLRLSFGLSRALGLMPYDSNCSLSRGWFIYSILLVTSMVTGCAISTIYEMFYDGYLHGEVTVTVSILALVQTGMQIVCLLAHLLSNGLYKSDFDLILTTLPEWDVTETKSTFSKFWTVVGLSFITFYIACGLLLGQSNWINCFCAFFHWYHEICVYLILVQFCTFLEVIEIRLKKLIVLLKRNRDLVFLAKAHYTLVVKSTTVNSVYSWQILIICTMIFIHFVSWSFYVINETIKLWAGDSHSSAVYYILVKLLFCAWQLISIFLITRSCENVVEKVESFNYELFRIMRESEDLCDNDALSLYVSMNHTVNFTACGFFSLGFPLLTSIIAAASTYLVILIQFSMPSPNTSIFVDSSSFPSTDAT